MSKEEKAITLVVENLENILSNPANNHLPISVMQVIETSVRLLKVESSQLTAYKEVLRELVEGIEGLPPLRAIEGVLEKQYLKAKTLIE